MAQNNGRQASGAVTKEAKKLANKDFSSQVLSLSEKRMISRTFMRHAVGEFDPEHISIPRMYQMRKDPMLQMGLHYCKFPLIRAKWVIECEDPAIAAGITEIVRNVYGSYVRTMLNMLDFGFQGAIKRFELGRIDGTYEDENGDAKKIWDNDAVQPLVLRSPIQLFPEWTTPKLKDGQFDGINTMMGSSGEKEDDRYVPREWALWTVNEFEENFHNWYGYPRTGYAYRYWWSYWFRFHMEDRHFEQDADPALSIQYPPGFSEDQDGGRRSNKEIALEIGNELRAGATIAWPSDVHVDEQGRATTSPMWSAQFLTGGENLRAFRESSEYLDVMKLRAVLVPEQALIEGKGGTSSRNAAATYSDVFNESLGQMAEDLDEQWNKHIIPQLVEANWGADAPRAYKRTSGFNDDDLTLTNELIKIAFQLDPNALPINFEEMIKMANLPMMTVKEQEQRDEEIAQLQFEQQQAARAQQRQMMEQQLEEGMAIDQQQGEQQLSVSVPEDKTLFLEQTIEPKVPEWAKEAHQRRERNIEVTSQRMRRLFTWYYREMVQDTVRFMEMELGDFGDIESEGRLSLAFRDRRRVKKARGFFASLMGYLTTRTRDHGMRQRTEAEVASAAHAAGVAELARLGLPVNDFDIGRRDIQDFAKQRAQYLIDGSEGYEGLAGNFVAIHIRPYLEKKFQERSYTFDRAEVTEMANELREKMGGEYPQWMAERVARTETRHAYNNAAIMVWQNAGIVKVQAFDEARCGRPECINRNGKIFTIPEARVEDQREHPNGSLGFVPVIDETVVLVPVEQWRQMELDINGSRSDHVYVVNDDGFILSEEEVGRLLAGQ